MTLIGGTEAVMGMNEHGWVVTKTFAAGINVWRVYHHDELQDSYFGGTLAEAEAMRALDSTE